MVGGDIIQRSWKDIKKIHLNYSRETMKKGRGFRFVPDKLDGYGV